MADQTTQNWFQKNQVFLSGLAGALTLVLQQFINTAEINYKAVGLAVLLATASYIGNQWRGKGVTVLGFLRCSRDSLRNYPKHRTFYMGAIRAFCYGGFSCYGCTASKKYRV
jgi:hypothetical protein